MPVNDFEKQVQQKMDELKFTPSPEVWSEVEMRIRKEKKRRRVIFWWVMPLLLIGGGVVFYFSKNKVGIEDKAEVKVKVKVEDKDIPTNSTVATSIQKTGEGERLISTDKEANSQNNVTRNSNGRGPGLGETELVVSITAPKTKTQKKPGNTGVREPVPMKEEMLTEISGGEKNRVNPFPVPITEKVSDGAEVIKEKSVVESPTPNPIKNDSLNNLVEEKKEQPEKTEKKNQSSKWTFGVATELGSSNTLWGPLIGGQARYDFAQYSAPGVGSGSAFNPVYIPAPENGLSFGFSVFAQKELTKRFDIRANLQYNNFSTHTTIGNHIDSTRVINNSVSDRVVDNYYRPPTNGNAGHEYTNHYHLAGLSISLGWKIINKKKFSLSWENGIGYNRLLSTNALHFDRNLGAYYEDFDAFKKSQFLFTTGLSAPIIRKSKFELSINPFLSYGLSPVLKGSNGPTSHYINGGVGLRFSFPR